MPRRSSSTPLDLPELNARGCEYVARGVELYAKRLDKIQSELADAQKIGDAQRLEQEAGGLRSELVEPLKRGDPPRILPSHLPAIRAGLRMLAKNIGASRGTLTPLPETEEWIEDLTNRAAWVTTTLLPMFEEQHELDIRPAGGKAAGAGLKALADAEAEG